MKQRFLIGAMIGFLLLPSRVFAAVVINEIFPKTEDTTREWVELYNTGSDPVSLNMWKLANTTGTTTTFGMGALVIQSHNFLTLYQPQTGITFDVNGDTIVLTDDHGTVVDSETYPSTLGFNTAMGRSPDGGNSWTICNVQTPNQTNDCPPATPTPSPTPTPIPTNTPTPTATDTPTPTEEVAQGLPMYHLPAAATAQLTPSPTPTLPSDNLITIHVPAAITITRSLAIQIVVVAVSWILLIIIAFSRRKRPHKHEK